MKLADLVISLRRVLGDLAPDRPLLRVWTEEAILLPEGGGSWGKHRSYADGEVIWAVIAAFVRDCGLRGTNLKAAMISLRTWNYSKEAQPIPDSGFESADPQEALVWDQLGIVRASADTERPTYAVVENMNELLGPQPPHVRVSLVWIARLLRAYKGEPNDTCLNGRANGKV